MAHIRLYVQQADGHLPMVCMRCGAPATAVIRRVMEWHRFGIAVLRKHAWLAAPLCERHRNHWRHRIFLSWMIGLIGTGLLAAAVCPFAIVENVHPRPVWVDVGGPFICIACVIVQVGWVIAFVEMRKTAIRPVEITDSHITLSGVCNAFIEAIQNAEIEHQVRLRHWQNQDLQDEARGVRADSLNADMHKPASVDAIERGDLGRAPPTDAIQE